MPNDNTTPAKIGQHNSSKVHHLNISLFPTKPLTKSGVEVFFLHGLITTLFQRIWSEKDEDEKDLNKPQEICARFRRAPHQQHFPQAYRAIRN